MKGKFLTDLNYRSFRGEGSKTLIQLTQNLIYKSSDEEMYIVPKGFVSDGASIPKFAWSIVGHPFGEYLESAVIHDYPYKFPDKWHKEYKNKRKRADWLLLDCMKSQCIKLWKRRIMYRAVRLGGWRFWNDKSVEMDKE